MAIAITPAVLVNPNAGIRATASTTSGIARSTLNSWRMMNENHRGTRFSAARKASGTATTAASSVPSHAMAIESHIACSDLRDVVPRDVLDHQLQDPPRRLRAVEQRAPVGVDLDERPHDGEQDDAARHRQQPRERAVRHAGQRRRCASPGRAARAQRRGRRAHTSRRRSERRQAVDDEHDDDEHHDDRADRFPVEVRREGLEALADAAGADEADHAPTPAG